MRTRHEYIMLMDEYNKNTSTIMDAIHNIKKLNNWFFLNRDTKNMKKLYSDIYDIYNALKNETYPRESYTFKSTGYIKESLNKLVSAIYNYYPFYDDSEFPQELAYFGDIILSEIDYLEEENGSDQDVLEKS